MMSWRWAALMPHPPIVVPEVHRGTGCDAQDTMNGMTAVAQRIRFLGVPDVIMLLSPHQPYVPGSVAFNTAPYISGSFESFGAPDVTFEIESPSDAIMDLADYLRERGSPAMYGEMPDLSRDQGSSVPLYFLRRSLGSLPFVLLASPIGLDATGAYDLGRVLADFDDGRSWGLLASGDLSHRLKHGGPNGYSPAGEVFDRAVVESLESNDASRLLGMTCETVDEAGECGMRSVLAMLGLVRELDASNDAIDVLSYEGPYGVGYCTALWGGVREDATEEDGQDDGE